MQAYSNPKRENDPHALPDIEYWLHVCKQDLEDGGDTCPIWDDENQCSGSGWYYWFCFPGCLPDGDPIGPFATEAEALADAQSDSEDD